MLAALFIQGGVNALRSPQPPARAAKPVLDVVADVALPDGRPQDETLVRIDAAVKITAGSLLAFGRFPRLAATALAASLVPTTLAAHRFWEETDPELRRAQQIHFLKNVGLLGGLLIAAADTAGRPSLGWRGRRAARLAGVATSAQLAALSGAASEVSGRMSGATHQVKGRLAGGAHDGPGTVAGIAAGLAGLAPAAGAAVSARAERLGAQAGDLSQEWSKRAAKASKRAGKRRAKLQKIAERRGVELQKRAAKRGAELQKRAAKRGAALQKAAERKIPRLVDQASRLGSDVAARTSVIGSEVARQAEGAATDARKRVHALTR